MPLLATTHMLGDMAHHVFGVMAISYIFTGEMIATNLMLPFILLISGILLTAPGTPGGVATLTRPFRSSSLLLPENVVETCFTLSLANDSSTTGTNVVGDSTILIALDAIHKKWFK